MLRRMFDRLVARPKLMPDFFQQHAEDVGVKQAVAHYLAGMTDGYCRRQSGKILGSASGG
jgi:dGTP triphosphohydrolase